MELRGVLESSDPPDPHEGRRAAGGVNEAASALYAKTTAPRASAPATGAAASDDQVVEDADYEVVEEEEEPRPS